MSDQILSHDIIFNKISPKPFDVYGDFVRFSSKYYIVHKSSIKGITISLMSSSSFKLTIFYNVGFKIYNNMVVEDNFSIEIQKSQFSELNNMQDGDFLNLLCEIISTKLSK